MADCEKYQEMLSAYLDGELPEAEKDELEKHIDGCASCRALLLVYKEISEMTAGELAEPPKELTSNVMDAVRREAASGLKEVRPRKAAWKPVVISFAALAACAALVFAISPGLFRAGSSAPSSGTGAQMSVAAPQNGAGGAGTYDMQMEAKALSPTDESEGSTRQTGTQSASDATTPATASESPEPTPEAGTGSNLMAAAVPSPVYFATFKISGELPEKLKDIELTDNGDGTKSAVIPLELAKELIADNVPYEAGDENADQALVIYTPTP